MQAICKPNLAVAILYAVGMAIFLVVQVFAAVEATEPITFQVVPPSNEPITLQAPEPAYTYEKLTIGETAVDKSIAGVAIKRVLPEEHHPS